MCLGEDMIDPHIVSTVAPIDWASVAGILGAITTVLGFLFGIIWKVSDSRKKRREVSERELSLLQQKIEDLEQEKEQEKLHENDKRITSLERIINVLADDYNELKLEVNTMKTADDKCSRDIEKLEYKIDKLIDMMIRVIEDK